MANFYKYILNGQMSFFGNNSNGHKPTGLDNNAFVYIIQYEEPREYFERRKVWEDYLLIKIGHSSDNPKERFRKLNSGEMIARPILRIWFNVRELAEIIEGECHEALKLFDYLCTGSQEKFWIPSFLLWKICEDIIGAPGAIGCEIQDSSIINRSFSDWYMRHDASEFQSDVEIDADKLLQMNDEQLENFNTLVSKMEKAEIETWKVRSAADAVGDFIYRQEFCLAKTKLDIHLNTNKLRQAIQMTSSDKTSYFWDPWRERPLFEKFMDEEND